VTIKRFLTSLAVCAAPAFSSMPAAAAGDEAVSPALRDAFMRLDNQLPLRAADHTALKKAAAERVQSTLRVCGDPGNLPLSDINRAGFQNKVIELVAKEIGAEVNYFWRPYLMRGITRQTFDTNDCDLLLDMPATGFEGIITTNPIYKTSYVLAFRNDRGIEIDSLDDPDLKTLKIGVFQTSGLRTALTRRGIISNVSLHVLSHNADLKPENQPYQQVQKVIDGQLDVAGVWGPFAGWLKTMKGEPLTIVPTNMWEEDIPQEFELAIGLRRVDWVLKYKLDLALEARRAEIEKILREYGVPLVKCSKCTVPGDLPAHGAYNKVRVLSDAPPDPAKKAKDQIVDQARLDAWLAEGADVNQEFANAVLAGDVPRMAFLAGKGADVNRLDKQGYSALHSAARRKDEEIIKALIGLEADVNARDQDGYSALDHAVLRNFGPGIDALAAAGVDLDARNKDGFTPLAIAIIEDQFKAAMALIGAGASIEAAVGDAGLTPLMLAAGKEGRRLTLGAGVSRVEKIDPKEPDPLMITRALIDKGANVNAVSTSGVTALILAAAHNNAPIVGVLAEAGADRNFRNRDGKTASDIAQQNGNTAVVSLLRLLDQATSN
jgi:quinoprotein dehydrogenase-associated probable ABC transporter substrate-binding protein